MKILNDLAQLIPVIKQNGLRKLDLQKTGGDVILIPYLCVDADKIAVLELEAGYIN